jgi:hypothetical protein
VIISSTVGTGVGEAILGPGVGDGYRALMSLLPLREISQAANTPATASTTTIAKIHGKELLRDPPPRSLGGAAL